MECIFSIRTAICSWTGALGSLAAMLLGGWSADLTTLVILMGVDFVTGLILASLGKSTKSQNGSLSSSAGWHGLAKKVITFLLILVAYRVDLVLGVNYLKTAVTIAFIVNELLSVVENAALLGIPMPAVLMRAIDLLREKEQGGGMK